MTIINLGLVGYGATALLFLAFSALLLTTWRGRLQGGLLVLIGATAALWAGLSAGLAGRWLEAPVLTWTLEVLRNLLLSLFLLRLLETLAAGKAERQQFLRRLRYGVAVLCLLLLLPIETMPESVLPVVELRLILQVLLPVLGLALVEQLYRNTPWDHRWGIKYLCFGIGILFAFDFYLYADALLFRRLDPVVWQARGVVAALTVPLLGIAAARNPQWSIDFFVSRTIVFHTTAIFAAGVYLVAMAGVGYYIRIYEGEWGRVLQVVFLAGAGALLLLLMFSGQFRSRAKVFITKHFFSYRFDYREEWLHLIGVLSGKALQAPLHERVIFAVAEIVDSPGGALWLCTPQGGCRHQLARNLPEHLFQDEQPLGSLIPYLQDTQWVINLEEYRKDADYYEGLDLPEWLLVVDSLWLIVPLFHENEMLGFLLLAKPRAPQRIDWETIDLLKIAGRQVAGYLALDQTATALAEARQFEGFNRLSAFVMHDLKNIIAQLALVSKNAARHKANPEFIDDAFLTVRNSVERMNRLLHQLRTTGPRSRSDRIDLVQLLRHVVAERKLQEPVPEWADLPVQPVWVSADRDRLGAVIGHVVQNAQDAAGSRGWVRVRLHTESQTGLIEVEDNGAGMDDLFIRTRLFKPFFSTKGLTGMGIGAYECREFVQGLGGRVQVKSQPGEGTLFSIYLPLAQEQSP